MLDRDSIRAVKALTSAANALTAAAEALRIEVAELRATTSIGAIAVAETIDVTEVEIPPSPNPEPTQGDESWNI